MGTARASSPESRVCFMIPELHDCRQNDINTTTGITNGRPSIPLEIQLC